MARVLQRFDRKYYESNTRVFSYELPEGADASLDAALDTTSDELAALVCELFAEHGDDIAAVAREMKPCEYCETQHYEEFVLRELLDRALVRLGEDGTLEDLLDRTLVALPLRVRVV